MSGGASMLLSVGFVIQGVGLVLHIVGMATDGWSYAEDNRGGTQNIGLWNVCDVVQCPVIKLTDNKRAAQAFAIIGAIFGGGGAALSFINVLLSVCQGTANKTVSVFAFIGSVIAFNAIDVAAAVWASNMSALSNFPLGYSFGLAVCGSLLIPLGGLCGLVLAWQSPGAPNRPTY